LELALPPTFTVVRAVAIDILLFIIGVIVAALTLGDVFGTVVVPGGSRALLRVTHRVVFTLLPVWKYARGRRRGLSSMFAPLALVLSFTIWMVLLTFAFGLMAYALRHDFQRPITSIGDAFYLVGSSLATVGLSESHPHGPARWVILAAGFCGLGVMTMAVTYLLEVQNSITRRDTGIIKLNTSAGEPPSALTLLERFAAIRNTEALRDMLEESRNWCATVRQSHASHPSLIYFQSVGTGAGWPAALGAVLDLAWMFELCVDDDHLYGPAVLLGAEGTRMARDLAKLINLDPQRPSFDEQDIHDVAERLAASGYEVRPDPDFAAIMSRRSDYQSCVEALAEHLGRPATVLIRR
jgi:hypothetical protein